MNKIIITNIDDARTYAKILRAYNTQTKETIPAIRAELLKAIDAGLLDEVRDEDYPNRFYLFDDDNKRSAWISRVCGSEPKTIVDNKKIAEAWATAHNGETLEEMAAKWYKETVGDLPMTTTSGKKPSVQSEHQTSKTKK